MIQGHLQGIRLWWTFNVSFIPPSYPPFCFNWLKHTITVCTVTYHHAWTMLIIEAILWASLPPCYTAMHKLSLQWRHNGHDGVSNHQPHHCLLNPLFGRRSKKTSKLRVTGLCVGNSPGPVNSPHKGPVTRKMFPFDDVIMGIDEYMGSCRYTLHIQEEQAQIQWRQTLLVCCFVKITT